MLNPIVLGRPLEPGKFSRNKLTSSQINHFLDFLQFGGVIQDVASGTRTVELANGRKSIMPNVVRIMHKAEIVRLYMYSCDLENYTQENGRPSERTIWNMLNNCPSSQRKSLAGLDTIASDGSDGFDKLFEILRQIEDEGAKKLCDDLKQAKRYLKGDYKCHVAAECDGVADHCRIYALSDPHDKDFQGTL